MEKEEQILFPMISQGIYPDGPIFVMEKDHDDHIQALSDNDFGELLGSS